MTTHLDLVLLDQEIAYVAALSGNAQRAAAVKLALRETRKRGGDPGSIEAVSVDGVDLSMRVIRDADGHLQLDSICCADVGRLG